MPGVELTSRVCDGQVVVALHGELDITGTAGAEAVITVLVARGQCLVIDMSSLDFMDCCSLGALKRVRARVRHGGGDLVLAAPQPLVRRLLALTGADDVFWVEASVDAAVAGIARRRERYSWRRLAVRTARPGMAAPSPTGTE